MLNVPGKKRWLAVPRLFVGLIDVVDVARVEVELVVDVDKLVKNTSKAASSSATSHACCSASGIRSDRCGQRSRDDRIVRGIELWRI